MIKATRKTFSMRAFKGKAPIEIDLSHPQFINAYERSMFKMNEVVQEFVSGYAAQTHAEIEPDRNSTDLSELRGRYCVNLLTDKAVSIVFEMSTYCAGDVSPRNEVVPLNLFVRNGKNIDLLDFCYDNDSVITGMKRLFRDVCIKKLRPRLLTAGFDPQRALEILEDPQLIDDVIAKRCYSYGKKGITLILVLPYGLGVQKVFVSYKTLSICSVYEWAFRDDLGIALMEIE